MIDIGESSFDDRCMTEQARKCYIREKVMKFTVMFYIMKAEY